jgi:hypothetical protein
LVFIKVSPEIKVMEGCEDREPAEATRMPALKRMGNQQVGMVRPAGRNDALNILRERREMWWPLLGRYWGLSRRTLCSLTPNRGDFPRSAPLGDARAANDLVFGIRDDAGANICTKASRSGIRIHAKAH